MINIVWCFTWQPPCQMGTSGLHLPPLLGDTLSQEPEHRTDSRQELTTPKTTKMPHSTDRVSHTAAGSRRLAAEPLALRRSSVTGRSPERGAPKGPWRGGVRLAS